MYTVQLDYIERECIIYLDSLYVNCTLDYLERECIRYVDSLYVHCTLYSSILTQFIL